MVESLKVIITGTKGEFKSGPDFSQSVQFAKFPKAMCRAIFVPRSYSAVFVPSTGSGKEWVSVKMPGRWLKVIRWDTPTVSVVVATVVLEVFDTTKSCWDSCTRTNKLETALDRGLQWHRSQNRNC